MIDTEFSYVIEKSNPADIPTLVKLFCDFKEESQTVSPIFDELTPEYTAILASEIETYIQSEDSLILVARSNLGNIVGFIIGTIWKYLPIYRIKYMGYIPELYVVPLLRRRGIARMLIASIEDWFRTKGVLYSRIETMCLYAKNRELYERCGYQVFLFDMRKELH